MQDIHGRHVNLAHLADQQHRPGNIGDKVQLFGVDIDVAGKDIIRDDVFHKGPAVMLFLIAGFGTIEGNTRHNTQALCQLILAIHIDGIVEPCAPALQGLKGFSVRHRNQLIGGIQAMNGVFPLITQTGRLRGCDHIALAVNDAQGAVAGILHLHDNTLKHSAGHSSFLLLGSANPAPPCFVVLLR